MLKHVSYRASNTSLGRPFGQPNCRVSQTSRTSLQPQQLSNDTHPDSTSSAPNSPEMCHTRYHQRHHSITPVTNHSHDEQPITPISDSNRRSYARKSSKIYYPTMQRTSTATYTHGFDLQEDANFSYDSFTLKPDDPLSKHKKDLRSVDPSTLNGGDLMVNVSSGDCSDTISLHSSISFDTLSRTDFRASAMSLSNNSSSAANKVPVRIHLRQLRPDIEYKTLKLDASTTCRQLIEYLLHKLRLKHRDPNLFVVVLEAAVKGPAGGAPVKKTFLLEDSARPVELQQCRPFGEANFSINTRKGGVLRVKDSVLAPGSQYKSFLVSATSSVVEVIQLLLRCNNRSDDWRMFTLHEVCADPYADRLLGDDEKPLTVQATWPKTMRQQYSLVLRRHLTQGLMENGSTWRRLSIDDCSMDADTEIDEHNSTCSSILTNSSNSSRSRSSISSSTASVLSLASLSSNNSSRCSFSSGSSSGVSSGSSSYSPSDTPDKDRKNIMPKRLLPLQHCTPKTFRKIDVEQNVQSYFTIPPDDEVDGLRVCQTVNSCKDDTVNVKHSRPPHPLPRKVSSTPLYVNTAPINIKVSREEDQNSNSNNFRKSFSAIFSPSFSKIRDSSLRRDRSSTRSSRIRSATIASIEHMANLSLYSRSKSTESKQNSSTTTLTSQPTSPSTPTCSNSIFSFKAESPSFLSKSQSTSSINNLVSPKFHLDHPVIVPSSTKLRPLSLAPNSCMAFPSRPQSLLSTQSQSTTTLRASSSSLCLVVSSPFKDTSCSFSNSSSGSSLLNSSTSSSTTLDLTLSPSHYNNTVTTDNASDISKDHQKIVPKNESENGSKKSEVRIIAMKKKCVMAPVNNGYNGSEKNNANHEKIIKEKVLPTEQSSLSISEQRCQTTCQYNRCFYI